MFKVNDILCASWGFEQTNIDFYQVVRVTKTMAVIREIAAEIVEAEGQYIGLKSPVKDKFIGEEIKRKVHNYGYDIMYIENHFLSACLWSGEPEQYTSYY